MRFLKLFIVIFFGVLLAISCTENRLTTNPPNGESVRVTGVVNGWFCEANNPFYPPNIDPRMAVYTGECPLIRATKLDGSTKEFRTDGRSSFRQLFDTGYWTFDIITRWSILDTFTIRIQRDTSIIFDLIYMVTNPDTLYLSFYYENGIDTLGAWREVSILKSFNRKIDDVLNLKSDVAALEWRVVNKYPNSVSVWYHVPLADRSANVIEVSIAANELLLADSSREISPVPLWTNGSYYICLASSRHPQ